MIISRDQFIDVRRVAGIRLTFRFTDTTEAMSVLLAFKIAGDSVAK